MKQADLVAFLREQGVLGPDELTYRIDFEVDRFTIYGYARGPDGEIAYDVARRSLILTERWGEYEEVRSSRKAAFLRRCLPWRWPSRRVSEGPGTVSV